MIANDAEKLQADYDLYYKNLTLMQQDMEMYSTLSSGLEFIQFTTPFETIQSNFYQLEPTMLKFKNRLRDLSTEADVEKIFSIEDRRDINYFLNNNLHYFTDERYDDENLKTLFACLRTFVILSNRSNLEIKKQIFFFQAGLIGVSS